MKERTTSSARSGYPACRARYIALAGAMLLSGGWGTATTAMAATPDERPDERIAAATTAESMAPLLFLTPRAASILEEVFDDSLSPAPPEAGPEKAEEPAVDANEQNEPSVSPVADARNGNTADGPLTVFDNAADLPVVQRQMYRTDI